MPRKRSVVWLHFEVDGQEAPSKATCQICGEAIQHSGNTSNMFKHLKKKHPVESAAIEDRERRKLLPLPLLHTTPKDPTHTHTPT